MSESPRRPTPDEVRRLALVVHLYRLASDQSKGAEPAAGLAVLTFHDAVEMFLQLASERHGVGKERTEFMDYWALLGSAGIAISQREAMRRLNAARRTLKHRGVVPAAVEVEGFRAATTNFLHDNCASVFGINFADISLTALVRAASVRRHIEAAEAAAAGGDEKQALECLAVAFDRALLLHEEKRHQASVHGRPYSLRESGGSLIRGRFSDLLGRELSSLSDDIRKVATRFSEAITVIGYGLDFESYLLFKSNIPFVVHYAEGDRIYINWSYTPTTDKETIRRCIAFVIDAALRLDPAGDGSDGGGGDATLT